MDLGRRMQRSRASLRQCQTLGAVVRVRRERRTFRMRNRSQVADFVHEALDLREPKGRQYQEES